MIKQGNACPPCPRCNTDMVENATGYACFVCEYRQKVDISSEGRYSKLVEQTKQKELDTHE